MAGKFLLTMTLARQGKVRGSSTGKAGEFDFSHGMECHGFSYEPGAPLDSVADTPKGKRHHKPITITKEVDSASPNLFQALATNEIISSAKLHFNSPDDNGLPSFTRTIELTDGAIASIKPVWDSDGTKSEKVTFVYKGLMINGIPVPV